MLRAKETPSTARDVSLYSYHRRDPVSRFSSPPKNLKPPQQPGGFCCSKVEISTLGLAVFSLSNERAGPKDRKYDPSRSHYKKVSLLRDRLIPAGGTTPTIIYSPFMEGTS
jgi:hypothetical protein